MTKSNILFFTFVLLAKCTFSQEKKQVLAWDSLLPGLQLVQIDAPVKSNVGDSKITIVQINPSFFETDLYTATSNKKQKLTALELADSMQYQILFNAGMYELSSGFKHRGFLKNGTHFNNSTINPNYNAMLCLDPIDSTQNSLQVKDLSCESWNTIKNKYASFSQGPRMIACDSEPMSWNKKKQSCSMLILGIDRAENVYLFFTRSPYSHSQMIAFIQQLPLEISTTMYLEGGPETSLYICTEEKEYSFIGSYVSDTYERDDNVHFWKLPNWIGLKQK